MNPAFQSFQKLVSHPVKFRLFLLQRLPAAFFAGLRLRHFDEKHTVVTVKYKWFNQNPFKSMYFAVQSMAAEMSTGLPAFAQVYKRNPAVSMLVVSVESHYYKKVTGLVCFSCDDGPALAETVQRTIDTGEAVTITCNSTGRNEAGEVVAEFRITWSFKAKGKRTE
ncbi:DUF4442 domain-containing protein [Sediminibacterium ginsengisoli]|uniref:Ig-like domain-containing protein n=1 Tax=Sediminibacterium ginsengisoli TaxID=413434 RepID=A0A1T4KB55_9BACT|nr:DUF4442 domain-containing protein [Sediminibacterium ginsengisoli]SJZ39698.1 protein of unknown function [Sediminibacterium ginsengisoli]